MGEEDFLDLISKILQKLDDLEARNLRLEEFIYNNFIKRDPNNLSEIDQSLAGPRPIVVEERVEPDERNISSYKKTMTPEGSLIAITGKPFCVSGKHLISDNDSILFCSKCGRTICSSHYVSAPPICFDCAIKEINMTEEEIYVLSSLVNNKQMEYEVENYYSVISSLEYKGYIKRKFLFTIRPTIKGVHALRLFEELVERNGRGDRKDKDLEQNN
ncbi:MAG: hypothetical protein QXV66_01740 [Candidatus Rehaiarchaeum fermentans]|nr:hypothetical protein [Candidatus Rehaiarchaeum fermentans]